MKMKHYNILLIATALFGMATMSCNPDKQEDLEQKMIREYLEDKGLTAQSTSSGLHYIIEVPGNNEHPTISDNITIAYTGELLNGNIFDSSPSATFPLANLIDGWKKGIPLFGKGGEGILIVPSHLGYGGASQPGIPGNSVLVFRIKLFGF